MTSFNLQSALVWKVKYMVPSLQDTPLSWLLPGVSVYKTFRPETPANSGQREMMGPTLLRLWDRNKTPELQRDWEFRQILKSIKLLSKQACCRINREMLIKNRVQCQAPRTTGSYRHTVASHVREVQWLAVGMGGRGQDVIEWTTYTISVKKNLGLDIGKIK